MYTFLLAITLTAAQPQFEARTVDGRTVAGPIVKLDARQVTIQAAEGPVSLETEKLMSLTSKEKPAPPAEEPGVWIDLLDGSSLVAREYTVGNGRARVGLLGGQAVEVPTDGIANVRLQPQPEEVAAKWSRILELQAENDVLVVRKGNTLDYHQGVLRDVTGEVVGFEFEGELLSVKRAKVHGLVYFYPPGGELPQPVCRLTDAGGSQWSVQSLAMPGDLRWTTPGGLTVARPLATVAQLDFSRGKVLFLSDLKPESVTFTPYFGTNADVPMLAKFYAPRNDQNLESGPLQVGKTIYRKGLALHSRTRIVYRLPGRFRRFQATVGIDDGVRPHGHVRLVISGDDKVLLEVSVSGTDPPQPVDVDLSGVRRLAILVDFGEKLDVADHLDLCDARIIK